MNDQERAGRTDAEFLRRLKLGDEHTWEQLLQEWQEPLYRYLCYSLPNSEIAKDVLGDTMVALVQAIRTFDGNVALSTFIYSLASRKIADFFRRSRVTSELPETLTVAGPNSDSLELSEALAQLPDEYRQALLLRYQVGLTVSEVAGVLERSYKATESLLSRGRKQLQEILESAGFS